MAAGAALLVAVLFHSTLLFGGSLHAHDWASHHWHYFDFVRTSLREFGTLPLFMNDAWITKNFLANAESPSLGPLVALLWWLETDAYVRVLVVVFSGAGLAGMLLLLHDLRVELPVAAFAALLFAFGGFFVSHLSVGHPWALGGQVLPLLVALYRRAALGSTGALALAALVGAFTILGGQHQPFIWQNLVLGAFAAIWALRARAWFPVTRIALLFALTAGLGAVKLLPMWAEFADYAPQDRTVGIPFGLLLTSLAGSGQSPSFAPAGLAYAHGAGWWEYAFFVGPLGLAWLVAGLVAARGAFAALAIGWIFLVMSFDWPPRLDPWLPLSELPVLRTQRSPSRFLFPALFAFSVAAALGHQRILAAARRRFGRGAVVAAWALALVAGAHLYVESLAWQRAALGPALASADHRPRPLVVADPGRGRAELVGFSPNRLVYRATASREARFVFPFRWGKGAAEWRVGDGLPVSSQRGKLAVSVPPGEREIAMTYRPRFFHAGAAASVATAAGLLAWIAFARGRAARAS